MLRLVLTAKPKKLFDVTVQWLYHDLTQSNPISNTQTMLKGIKIRSPVGFPAFPVHSSSDSLFIKSDLFYKH